MKKYFIILVSFCLLTTYSVQAQKELQTNGKAQVEKLYKAKKDTLIKQGEAKKDELKKKEAKLNKKKEDVKSDIEEKGNAYGKDKVIKGKEFSQEMTGKAKLKKEEKLKELNETLKGKNDKITNAEAKLKEVKEKLEKSKKEGTINEDQYLEKKSKIEKAEAKVKALVEKVKMAEQF